MTALQAGRFGDYFLAVHGYTPFPWQRRLAEQVSVGPWPTALALPTASGKTACIDIAVYALACQAGLPPAGRAAPRRIFFVVDRRVIVDAAFERAKLIARRLRDGRDAGGAPSPVLAEVSEALRAVGGGEEPLACFQLRGGVYRDQAWARTPTQPSVIASTVDQIGSRLLFRGYGVSDSLKPVHAGLAANDALVLLDEAHCARPFLQTVAAVADYRRLAAPGVVLPPFSLAVLSATPPPEADAGPVFRLDEEDRGPGHLGPRLHASKPVSLRPPVAAPGGKAGARKFCEAFVAEARRMVEVHGAQAVAVLVNRVDTARDIHARLQAVCQGRADAVLMTGRMRPLDRDRLLQEWESRLRSGADRAALARPVYVVATQCLEVGADFDFDAVVTECASLDALRQRFGRLNRLGRPIAARGSVLIRSGQALSDDDLAKADPSKLDPVYGSALAATWNWLNREASAAGEGRADDPVVDFGILALEPRLPADPGPLLAPSPDAPVMLPAHIDRWVQTAPRPDPDPDPALFLHGPDQGRPEVLVCWRGDLAPDLQAEEREARWIDTVSVCPPTSAECMPVPLYRFREWLAGGSDAGDESDLDYGRTPQEAEVDAPCRTVLRWCGPESEETCLVEDTLDVRPGDVVVVPVAEGGWEALGHIPGVLPHADDGAGCRPGVWRLDVAEQARQQSRRALVLRLHPALMADWPGGEARDTLLRISVREEDPAACRDQLKAALLELAESDRCPDWLGPLARSVVAGRRWKVALHPDHPLNAPPELPEGDLAGRFPRGLVILGPLGDSGESESVTTEDDSASAASAAVPLAEHLGGVAGLAETFASLCGLTGTAAASLATAARLHDIGKVDARFQAWLHNGNALAARLAPGPLAKGLPQSRHHRHKARQRSGYPPGARHELLSCRLAESLLETSDPAVDRDLVLHLIASHHGQVRPFAPRVSDPHPVTVVFRLDGRESAASSDTRLHRLDSGAAERFWRLTRRYGWWGLAWLEAILRLADHRRSELEERQAVAREDQRG